MQSKPAVHKERETAYIDVVLGHRALNKCASEWQVLAMQSEVLATQWDVLEVQPNCR